MLKKLEMDYLSIKQINPIVKNNFEDICFKGGKLVNSKVEGFSIDLANMLECGIVLFGPPPSQIIPSFDKKLLDEALHDKFNHIKRNSPKWIKKDFWNQTFVIIQLCRIIYSKQNRNKPVSKKKAATWCLKNVPSEFKTIIKTAIAGIDNWEKPINENMLEKIPKLINYTEKLLRV